MKTLMLTTAATLLALAAAAPAQADGPLRIDGTAFKDGQGRTLILRGVNLGGSSKIPYRTSADPAQVSYVGRPFPLAQADEHFARLKSWGFTTIRLIIMWEAVEHAGPGRYDHAYLDYLHALVRRGDRYGMRFIVDLHQDFYSRATGGDGAPYWTVTRLGLGPDRTNEPGAPHVQPKRGPGYWPPTAARYSVDTMDTLFWAGNEVAPGLQVDGVPVQDWLQGHYVDAMRAVATRLRDLPNVVAYDTVNEPNHGFLGVKDLREPEFFMAFVGRHAAPGVKPPSYWDLIQAASGFAPAGGTVAANNLWAPGVVDIWRRYGVWDVVDGKPTLLKPDHFARIAGREPDHTRNVAALDRTIARRIREIVPGALILQQPALGDIKNLALGLPGMISQVHWYDGVVLMGKRYEPNVTYAMTGWPSLREERLAGHDAVLGDYVKRVEQLRAIGAATGGLPTLVGETGIPYDLNDKQAYRSGDYRAQETLAGLMYETLDRTLSSYLIWNYTADNSHADGDRWGNEDLSIFTPDERRSPADINSGGRTLKVVVRPYPVATAGTPTRIAFDPATRSFTYQFTADPAVKAPTELFIPRVHYPDGYRVRTRNARYAIQSDPTKLWITDATGTVTVDVTPK